MDIALKWIAEIWDKFSIWTATQPTFVEVAIGVGLFYVVFLIIRAVIKIMIYLLSSLFSARPRFKRKAAVRAQGQSKTAASDDDAPPFIFR
jgi:hypothetical protein